MSIQRPADDRLRVALLAGVLGQGGAEKQFVYIARALMEMGIEVRVHSLTRGDHHEPALQQLGLEPVWVGRHTNPLRRLWHVTSLVKEFKPDIIQAGHFFTNIYVAFAARRSNCLGIGSIRNDAFLEMRSNGLWGPLLLKSPRVLLANSHTARRNAITLGRAPERVFVLHNVIDQSVIAHHASRRMAEKDDKGKEATVMMVCRLVAAKRVDRFLHALALARTRGARLRAVIVGDGPERARLQSIAVGAGLTADVVEFLGARTDVPILMKSADILALSSDHEGFPNVLLEAMVAGLPVVTTPAGDAGTVVEDGVTGFVVPFDDIEAFADRLCGLWSSPALCQTMGNAGISAVESRYGIAHLRDHLKEIYLGAARATGNMGLEEKLSRVPVTHSGEHERVDGIRKGVATTS